MDATFGALLAAVGLTTTMVLTFDGAKLVLDAELSLGTMLAFGALATGVFVPLNGLVTAALQVQMLEAYLERLNEVLDAPTEQQDGLTRGFSLEGAVRLENVSFRYPGQEAFVICDLSVSIEQGARVALVGRTGCGKIDAGFQPDME